MGERIDASRARMIMIRATMGLLVFGAVFVWFGGGTPFWSSLAWLGAVLLVVGSGIIICESPFVPRRCYQGR